MDNLRIILPLYITKHNFKLGIKTTGIILFIIMNIFLFSGYMFAFILLYIKQFTIGYVFDFKVFSFLLSIIFAWIDFFILSPILILPNLLVLIILDFLIGFFKYLKSTKQKLYELFNIKSNIH